LKTCLLPPGEKVVRDIIAGRCGTIQLARVLHAVQLPEALQSGASTTLTPGPGRRWI
jgi:hypothetical protein